MDIPSNLNEIPKICFKLFDSLPKTGKPKFNEWTVLSCIIEENNDKFEPVALGTGSKCIGKSKMSNKGDILNDSHAEVICRRAFLLYLYDQIEKSSKNENAIFLYDSELFKFSLKDVRFHFFTTLMPCGDASIFPKSSKNDIEVGDLVGTEPSDLKRSVDCEDIGSKRLKNEEGDIFRTGAKCLVGDEKQDPHGEGERYHVTGVVRTKPGRGNPTLSVSCTDKIAKWCYLGIQGALLSILLTEPIHLSTFIVASNTPFSEESLQRAFCDRFETVEMCLPYKKSTPKIYQAKNSIFPFQKSDRTEVSPNSIIYFKGESSGKRVEVAVDGKKQGTTRKNRNTKTARLNICKAEVFRRFQNIHNNSKNSYSQLTYRKCKENAGLYQKNWEIVKTLFKAWPKKDESLLEFSAD